MRYLTTYAAVLLLFVTPMSGAAQEMAEGPDDWTVAFTLSMAAAQYGGGCQQSSPEQCQIFAELWFLGQSYVLAVESCAAANDPNSWHCEDRQRRADHILETFGPVQGLDEVFVAVNTFFGDTERCLSDQNRDEPQCRNHERFLELLRE